MHFGGIHGYALAVVLSPFLAALPFGMKLGALHVVGRLSELAPDSGRTACTLRWGPFWPRILRGGRVFDWSALVGGCRSFGGVPRGLVDSSGHTCAPDGRGATDFVRNASKHDQGHEIWSYLVGIGGRGWISAAALGAEFGRAWLLEVFGPRYADGVGLMRVLLVGSLGAHVLRIPLGNLLSALGRANWNTGPTSPCSWSRPWVACGAFLSSD